MVFLGSGADSWPEVYGVGVGWARVGVGFELVFVFAMESEYSEEVRNRLRHHNIISFLFFFLHGIPHFLFFGFI
jgi:hypothetical protein